MHARTLRLAATAALATLAIIPLHACTSAYMDTLHEDMTLAPADLLVLRTTEAKGALKEAHTALQHLDDSFRDFAMTPVDGAERAGTDLHRLHERAQAAAYEARRRIASVGDVAPRYLRSTGGEGGTTAPTEESRAAYAELARALDAADLALGATTESLDRSLPTLGAAPAPGITDDLRATTQTALEALIDAIGASDRLLQTLAPR